MEFTLATATSLVAGGSVVVRYRLLASVEPRSAPNRQRDVLGSPPVWLGLSLGGVLLHRPPLIKKSRICNLARSRVVRRRADVDDGPVRQRIVVLS